MAAGKSIFWSISPFLPGQALHYLVELGYYCLNMTIHHRTSPSRPSNAVQTARILQTTLSVAILLATLFVAFSPRMFSGNFSSLLSGIQGISPQESVGTVATPGSAVRIGIVSGHWGDGSDPGAVCPDENITEQEVNLKISSLVRQKLEAYGIIVDLLQENDPRLDGYHAAMLLSIHADTCRSH